MLTIKEIETRYNFFKSFQDKESEYAVRLLKKMKNMYKREKIDYEKLKELEKEYYEIVI